MDDTYHIYLNRVVKLAVPGTYQTQVQNIQESYKFKPDATGKRQPAFFPGYTVITPTWKNDQDNGDFYARLKECQQELVEKLDPGLLMTIPPESFHLTLADVIWDNAYTHACKNPDFEVKLRSSFEDIFKECKQLLKSNHPIQWQVLGMMIMPRALAVCLVPKDEAGYNRLLEFRRLIYQNSGLMAVGIEQQYSFTAHITLGYFGAITDDINRDRICKTLVEINDQFVDQPPPLFCCKRAELHKFDDMTNYYRQPDWPSFQF